MPAPEFPRGLIAAPFTPLQKGGELNLALIGPYAAALRRDGITAAFVCGTTGEGASLSTVEREHVASRWRADKPADLRLVVHVGHNSLSDSQTLAQHAEKIGADAIAALAPGFFRPATIDDLVDWCAAVAGAAPTLPFYYYHLPAMTGVSFAMADFLPLAIDRIPTFAGIKFTHENLHDYSLTLEAAGTSRTILFGRDEILLSALVMGATGAVGSTYNYMAPIFNRVVAAFQNGQLQEARSQQLLAQQIITVMLKHGGLPAGKAIMSLVGLDCGPVRGPLASLQAEPLRCLRGDLEKAGFFDAVKADPVR